MILRIFPSRTNATPLDPLVRFDVPGLFDPPEGITAVHVSVTFTWDIPEAERLFKAWQQVHDNVKIGGPALGDPGDEFIPGRYLKKGYSITSRGCPNRCQHCMVPDREGSIREYPIHDGYNLQDNNILACSMNHFRAACRMLGIQKERAIFSGGLEARRLTPEHLECLKQVRIERVFFANDRPGDLPILNNVHKMWIDAGLPRRALCSYVMIGYPGDTMVDAQSRLVATYDAGFMPYAMLFRDKKDSPHSMEWKKLKKYWSQPARIRAMMKGRTHGQVHQD